MQIQRVAPYIEKLLQTEPWRSEVGETTGTLCSGTVMDLEWDGGRQWHCTACGRIGHSAFPAHESPPKSPVRLSAKDLAQLFANNGSATR